MNITSGKQIKAQKIILYGPEGIGKSTFASHFPDPLFSDTEGSTAHLDVKRFDKPTSWAMLMAQADYVRVNRPCKTYVIDTADWAEELGKEHIISLKSGFKSIEDYGYGKGFTMLAEEWGRYLNKLQEVIDAGIHVVILAHAHTRKFEQPNETGSYDRWELKLDKRTSALTKEWADAVLFATFEIYVENIDGKGAAKGKNKASGGARVMHANHHPSWDAKNRFGLVDKMNFTYQAIASYIPDLNARMAEVKQPSENISKQVAVETQPKVEGVPTSPQEVESTQVSNVGIELLPKNVQDLMKTQGITTEDLRLYSETIKGHMAKDTPFPNYPEDYLNGLVANWYTVVQTIRDYHGSPKLDITSMEETF